MRKPKVLTSFRELCKLEALKHPEEFDDDILEELEDEMHKSVDEFYDDPMTIHHGAYECVDIVTRPYKKVVREQEKRYWERERLNSMVKYT